MTELLLAHGWRLVTVSEFVQWFERRWPCPAAPSMVLLVDDTLANRRDLKGRTIEGHGRLLHAETKYYQICDHENRVAPELVIAYELRTPSLLRNGYSFANPAKWSEKESRPGHYASTTGNALFWSPSEPLSDMNGVPYFAPSKPRICRNRTFTFYLGDQWEPYQFTKSRFLDVRRTGDEISWSKTMDVAAPETDIRLTYHHTLKGPEHTIRVDVDGSNAEGLPARFRLCPYFHQGWDPPIPADVVDPVVPSPKTAGQERNVFGTAMGREFAFSDSNKQSITASIDLRAIGDGKPIQLSMFNRNPGVGGATCDDNPAMNRGFTVDIQGPDATVRFIDEPGANQYVTAVIELGKHVRGHSYTFTFRYWHGSPLPIE
jgi:hypothetical protein